MKTERTAARDFMSFRGFRNEDTPRDDLTHTPKYNRSASIWPRYIDRPRGERRLLTAREAAIVPWLMCSP
jgi:hypothetical protein